MTSVEVPRTPGAGGFAYVELLASLAILLLVAITASPIHLHSARQAQLSALLVTATLLADQQVSRLQAEPDATLAPGAEQVRSGRFVFDRSWTVKRDPRFAGLVWIAVSVVPRNVPSGRGIEIRFLRRL